MSKNWLASGLIRAIAALVVSLPLTQATASPARTKAVAESFDGPIAEPAIIPAPQNLELNDGYLHLPRNFQVSPAGERDGAKDVISYFTQLLRRTSAFRPRHGETTDSPSDAEVRFQLNGLSSLSDEEYRLTVSEAGILVRAGSPSGLFYGAVTLWQILTSVESGNELSSSESHLAVPFLVITDSPAFSWRGLMLDSARHFQPPEYIKRLIDWMALHKLNVFHWHLTDDQGWRLEIEKYPRLTDVGAWRIPARVGGSGDASSVSRKSRKYGGFYTQEEVREIVAYAQERFITIVPEIDMPGHVQAAIVAYPRLGVEGAAPEEIESDWGIFPHVFNIEEETFAFLRDVLLEVMGLFPGEYIHIGGDEVQLDQWRGSRRVQERMAELGIESVDSLQAYFTERMDRFLSSHDRRLIGWDEILEGGLSPNAAVMSWRGVEGAIEAARKGHDAILSPAPVLYFNNRQGSSASEPPAHGHLVTLEDVYRFDLQLDHLTAAQASHVKGVQANLWTEHVRTPERVSYMAFPRLAALAEIAWLPEPARDWRSFLARLVPMLDRYRALEINYAPSAFGPQIEIAVPNGLEEDFRVSLSRQVDLGVIRYSMEDTPLDREASSYEAPLVLTPPAAIQAASFYKKRRLSPVVYKKINAETFLSRRSQDMRSCSGKIPLYLEDDGPADGPRVVYHVDILDPCWIAEGLLLEGVTTMKARVGQVPFNFQVGDAVESIPKRSPKTGNGELVARAGDCESGPLIATLPLGPLDDSETVVVSGPVHDVGPASEVCFTFTATSIEPIWVLESVQFLRE